ncbi:MFS general substrate transporter, partial [Clathrospora elynae]
PSRTTAWLQVLVGHLVILNSFGLIQSFGIFQPRYETLLSSTPSQVAWIGSIHIFFVFFLGTFSGYLLDRGYYRECLGIGSALQVTGLLVAGFSRTWWMTFIFHGVFQGVGHGLMFCPAVTMTAVYFEGRGMKTTAMSLAGCGGAMGGILFPAIAKYTVDTRGIACTLWIMCGVVSATSALIQIFAQPKLPSSPQLTTTKLQASCLKTIKEKIRSLVDWRAFSDPGFSLYVLAMFCVFAGLWIPYFYIHAFSAKALHLTKSQSFTMLLALNGAGIPGRIVPALLSDYCLGTVNTHILLLLLTSATLICWPFITSPTGMVLWALAYGFCAGGVASLLQAGIASLNSEPRKTGSKIGMAFSVVAFASLLGVPVGGELIRMGRRDRGMGIEGFV